MVISFVVKDKTIFLVEETNPSIIVYVKDKDLGLDLEDYVIGVVAGEMPALFAEEALKAQAVAARSYAAYQLKNNLIDIGSSVSDQVFLTKIEMQNKWGSNYALYLNRVTSAVLETKNQVVKRDGKVLRTYYFAMSNGYTEDSQTVFRDTTFTGTESKWDNNLLNNFEVEKKYTAKEILKALKLSDSTIEIDSIDRSHTNHVIKIRINGKDFSGVDFRHKLGLRSTDFRITEIGNIFVITTRGYGHGVGMSQYGANGMAKEGYTYIEILSHYYNNSIVENI